MKTHILLLRKLNACEDAVTFASNYDTLQAAWDACPRGDWLLWFAGKMAGPPEGEGRLVLAACECARQALPIFEKRYPDDKRPRVCIETAEKWARGEATIEEVRKARNAAAAADADADAMRKCCADIVRKHYPMPPAAHEAVVTL